MKTLEKSHEKDGYVTLFWDIGNVKPVYQWDTQYTYAGELHTLDDHEWLTSKTHGSELKTIK